MSGARYLVSNLPHLGRARTAPAQMTTLGAPNILRRAHLILLKSTLPRYLEERDGVDAIVVKATVVKESDPLQTLAKLTSMRSLELLLG
jgi:hypothetical protein